VGVGIMLAATALAIYIGDNKLPAEAETAQAINTAS
jgi:hypothetical protein